MDHKPLTVLGLHCAYSHDSGACIVVDGVIRAAIGEERVSRVKKDHRFPDGAIRRAFEVARVRPADIDLVTLAAEDIQFLPGEQTARYLEGGETLFNRGYARTLGDRLRGARETRQYRVTRAAGLHAFEPALRSRLVALGLNPDVEVRFCDHHDCHMASLFFTTEAALKRNAYFFVVDAYGDSKSVSVYRARSAERLPELLLTMPAEVSPGNLYSRATFYLGMKPNRHEGKVTGLAAYGDPAVLLEPTRAILEYDSGEKRFRIACNEADSLVDKLSTYTRLALGLRAEINPTLRTMAREFAGHSKEDVAAAVQARFDEEILEFVSDVIGADAPTALLLAGGIFANVKTNALLAARYPDTELIVHPGMTDEGVAVGGALLGCAMKSGTLRQERLPHVYLGTRYGEDAIERFVAAIDRARFEVTRPDAPAEAVARLVDEGKAVGLFQGAMEYGPRALGNRTILADPRDRHVNDWLNRMLNRTEYMPFAPVVHEERASELFELAENVRYSCRFMTVTTRVREEWQGRIPGVVHVDGTARPQLIRRADNPLYYDLISAFEARTGIPALINTSFNLHEEPIVEAPEQALTALERGGIHALFLVPYLITLREVGS